jgi:hypothetical protein
LIQYCINAWGLAAAAGARLDEISADIDSLRYRFAPREGQNCGFFIGTYLALL